MELLERNSTDSRRWRNRGLVLWVLLAVSFIGCSIVGSSGGPPDRVGFNHSIHDEQGLTCYFCHKLTPGGGTPALPEKDLCLVCHKDSAQLAEVESFFVNYKLRRKDLRFGEEVLFSHPVHESVVKDCGDCHTGIRTSERTGPELRQGMDDCIACHERRGRSTECQSCHAQIDEGWAPENHEQMWMQRHGGVARARSGRTLESCALCHTESTCIDCHAVEQPESHTEFFRMRGHGLTAGMDRQSCAACHRSDFCIRCHLDTEPLSHLTNPTFGSPRNDHCLSCHYPLRSENCSVCHLGTPSHALAPPKPSWHSPAMDCRSCHQQGTTLNHAESGQDCNFCHR